MRRKAGHRYLRHSYHRGRAYSRKVALVSMCVFAYIGGGLDAQAVDIAAETDGALSHTQEKAIEAEVWSTLPTLEVISDEARIKQLKQLAARLTERRAYCSAAKHLKNIQQLAGGNGDNSNAAAQTFYMCARTRLTQGNVLEAADYLQRSVNIVGDRPEHRDMFFKMALVRARNGMDQRDVPAIDAGLTEAKRLGVDMGPGGGKRLAPWAIPVINATVKDVAVWSRILLDAGERELADAASKVAVAHNPNDRIAEGVRRDLVLGGAVLPMVAAGAGGLMLIGFGYWGVRARRIRRAMLEDDELA